MLCNRHFIISIFRLKDLSPAKQCFWTGMHRCNLLGEEYTFFLIFRHELLTIISCFYFLGALLLLNCFISLHCSVNQGAALDFLAYVLRQQCNSPPHTPFYFPGILRTQCSFQGHLGENCIKSQIDSMELYSLMSLSSFSSSSRSFIISIFTMYFATHLLPAFSHFCFLILPFTFSVSSFLIFPFPLHN